MKRIAQLQPLSMEHHQSLLLAKKCKDIAATNDSEKIQAFSQELVKDFYTKWENHFQIEEETIFNLANTKGQEIQKLCQQLQQEHDTFRLWASQIKAGDLSLIKDFGALIHDHTRLEERALFPLVSENYNQKELDSILQRSNQ